MSEHLLRACAAIDGTDLDDICQLFDVSADDVRDIREETSGIFARRFKALSLWKRRAERPTVGKLLGLLKQIKVGPWIVRKNYEALGGR